MKKILVTGGCGFIGSHFVNSLKDRYPNAEIVIVDCLTYAGDKNNIKDVNCKFEKFNITNPVEMRYVFDNYIPDTIFHFAAESFVDKSIRDSYNFIRTNINGTHILLDEARIHWEYNEYKDNLFVHVSTDEVYGSLQPKEKSSTEESLIKPNNPYAASKAASDLIVRSYVKTYGFPAIITHGSNTYGTHQYPEKLIPVMIKSIINNKFLPIYGDGLNIRDWIFVDDHCSALMNIVEKGKVGEVYNIGADNEITNLDLIKTILKIMNKPESLISFVDDRAGHDRRYSIDSSKLKKLGWKPEFDFIQSLKETIEWYIEKFKMEK